MPGFPDRQLGIRDPAQVGDFTVHLGRDGGKFITKADVPGEVRLPAIIILGEECK